MTLVLELSPQEEARLREKAARQGQDGAAYAVDTLRQDLSNREYQEPVLIPQGTPEWSEALRNIGRGRQGVPLCRSNQSRKYL